ncbi:MAG: penicillin-binding protein 2 [Chthoniobacter sp.]|nr:penicillin-binding protein 2 [Chthoniobacter sp.]
MYSTLHRPKPWHTHYDLRLLFLGVCILLGLGVLLLRLWKLQVTDEPLYTARLASNAEVRVRIPPIRGDIRDRNGVILAQNRASFSIEFYLPEMVRAYRARYGSVPMISYVGRVRDMAKVLREPDIVQIVNTAIVPRLQALGLPTAYDAEDLTRHFRIDTELPFPFLEGANFATVARFSEHDIGLPGVRITMQPMRHYLYGALGAHVLGYVGDPQEISRLSDALEFEFYEPNVEGKAQIEESMDKYLQGRPGVRLMQRNLKGVIDKEMGEEPPRRGSTVYLTMDARIQFIAERALRAVGRAGAVVVDPNNGAVLAMASVPSFDPNAFIPSIPPAAWQRLIKDPTDPLVNRAISAFPPGSTFKAVTALAGLRNGLAEKEFTCTGGVSYGDHYFQCWKSSGHGRLALSEAIKVSCNAFFYQYGNAAGIESIDIIGTKLGLGQMADLGLTGEQSGILPGPEWLKLHSPTERWSTAQTANVSIGQGYDLVSPLQLAMVYSAVANGGTAYYPRLVDKVIDADGRPQSGFAAGPHVRAHLSDAGVNPADIELVRTGLWKVVNEDGGTGGRARLAGGTLAGKTGTAQAHLHGRQDTIAWFVGFAPFEKPRYTVVVMVQGGAHGGSVAAPIAARILEETLAMDEGAYQPPLAPLPPAQHQDPFRMIEAVKLEDFAVRAELANEETADTPSPVAADGRSSTPRVAPTSIKKTLPKKVNNAGPRPEPTPAHRSLFQWLFHAR